MDTGTDERRSKTRVRDALKSAQYLVAFYINKKNLSCERNSKSCSK